MAAIPFVHARLAAVLLALFTTSFPARIASAQVATGSIVGTITDSSGQLVPGAQVTIREVNRNTTTTLVTDASGVYTAPFLVPGTYEVQVELQGFKTWIRRGIILQVNDRARVDVALEVGTVIGDDDGRRQRAGRANRFLGGRHGHRGDGDQGAAAERPELRHAGVSGARHHAGTGGREPLGREHVQPARRLQLQCARVTRRTPMPG